MYVMCACLRQEKFVGGIQQAPLDARIDRALLHFRQASERGIGESSAELVPSSCCDDCVIAVSREITGRAGLPFRFGLLTGQRSDSGAVKGEIVYPVKCTRSMCVV